jgi:hypothetical protein
MTPGQQSLAEGFSDNLAEHGQTWTRTSDGAQIVGIASAVKVEVPAMAAGQDRDFGIVVADPSLSPPLLPSQVMPSARLKKGDELTKGSRNYRVVRSDFQESNAMWMVILSPNF